MGYNIGQLEIPSRRSKKKHAKKARSRKIRREAKRSIDFVPRLNRYNGYQ